MDSPCLEDYKRDDSPAWPISEVRRLASRGLVDILPRAINSAIELLPYKEPRPGAAAVAEITYILSDLEEAEHEFAQCKIGKTPADVYRVNWEEIDIYIKVKIEESLEVDGELNIVVISFKRWTS